MPPLSPSGTLLCPALPEGNSPPQPLTAESELALLRTVLDALPVPVFFKDAEGLYLGCNRRFEEFLGLPREKIIGRSVFDVAPEELAQVYLAADRDLMARGGTQVYESSVVSANGRRQEVVFHKAVFNRADGSPGGLVGTMIDVSERKEAEAAARYLAHFDPLTQLPNQVLFTDRLNLAIAHSSRLNQRLAVFSLDLDHFQKINVAFGHQQGNELLKRVGKRLTAAVRPDDTVARMGGDSYLLLLPDIQQGENALKIAQKVRDFLRRPFQIDGQEVFLTASIGIAVYPEDGEEPGTLLKNACSALREAKAKGRNAACFYTPAMNARAAEQLALENQLRKALEREEFSLLFQPQMETASGRVTGVEALLRWRHPQRGLLLPGDFIPLAEESDFIIPLGEWVLEAACAQAAAWRREGLPPLRMAVNISPRQLRFPGLVDQVERALGRSGLAPGQLSLELTESSLMENLDHASTMLARLKAVGVHLAIDDFGTGYSSLTYLKRLPLDMVKIDRSFIADIPSPGDDRAIVTAVVAMAHHLNLSVLAEGVQAAGQREFLAQLGCDECQGYFCGRPATAAEIGTFLKGLPAGGS